MTTFAGQVDGRPETLAVEPSVLVLGARRVAHVDVDGVLAAGHTVTLALAGGERIALSHLGRRTDEFVTELTSAWRRARRAALLQWSGDRPIDEFAARRGEEDVTVVLFPDGVTVEGRAGVPEMAPFSLLERVERVERGGYTFRLVLRGGLEPVVVRQLGRRTDEFALDLERARADHAARTVRELEAVDASLAGFAAPDGWAVTAADAGRHWGALLGVLRTERPAEIDELARRAGDGLRAGVKLQVGAPMPFVLAPIGSTVVVEGAGEDEARATFVFRTDDVDRLNVALLLTSFRREAIALPDDQLGRWAVAARLLPVVRWARGALVARIVHDGQWATRLAAAVA